MSIFKLLMLPCSLGWLLLFAITGFCVRRYITLTRMRRKPLLLARLYATVASVALALGILLLAGLLISDIENARHITRVADKFAEVESAMSKDAVRNLLGKPMRIWPLWRAEDMGPYEHWTYRRRRAAGHLTTTFPFWDTVPLLNESPFGTTIYDFVVQFDTNETVTKVIWPYTGRIQEVRGLDDPFFDYRDYRQTTSSVSLGASRTVTLKFGSEIRMSDVWAILHVFIVGLVLMRSGYLMAKNGLLALDGKPPSAPRLHAFLLRHPWVYCCAGGEEEEYRLRSIKYLGIAIFVIGVLAWLDVIWDWL